MIVEDISFDLPEKNLTYDDELLKRAEAGESGEVLRFWESSTYFVVLGRICKEEEDVNLETVKRDNVPVLRRSSGGGTVLQGPGCMNYSLILAKNRHLDISDLRRSYSYILGKVINALESQGVQAIFQPISDLALKSNNKKFSGNAQKRGRNFILHHGTILYNFDLTKISTYLKLPKSQPDYRQNRPHSDFVTNIKLDVRQFKHNFALIF